MTRFIRESGGAAAHYQVQDVRQGGKAGPNTRAGVGGWLTQTTGSAGVAATHDTTHTPAGQRGSGAAGQRNSGARDTMQGAECCALRAGASWQHGMPT